MNKKIQILRAVAILAVLVIHTYPDGDLGIVIRSFVNFAVALFLFLSGYLTKLEIKNKKQFYKKRITKVLIPYIIWTIIYSISRREISVMAILKNIFTMNGCFTFYYIFVYIQLVLITPYIKKIVYSNYKYIPFVVQFIYIIIIRYILYFYNYSIPFPWNVCFFITWISYYYLGIMAGNDLIPRHINFKKIISIYFVSIIIQLIESFIWYKLFGNYDMSTTQVKISSMFTSLILLLICYYYIVNSNFKVKENNFYKFMLKIGDLSFGIYLCHPAVIMVFNKLKSFIPAYIFPLKTIYVLFATIILLIIFNKIFGDKISKLFGIYK